MVDVNDMFNDGMDVITFGAWSAAHNAFQSAAGAADDIANGISQFTTKTLTLMGDLDAILVDTGNLMQIKQAASRHYVDLTPEEKAVFDPLMAQESSLITTYRATDPKRPTDTPSLQNFVQYYLKANSAFRAQRFNDYLLASEILDIRKAELNILWNKPGVIPETLSEVKKVLEQVRKVDQPLVEKTLGDVNNLLGDADNLISIKRGAPKDISELSDEEGKYLGQLRTWEDDLQISIKAKQDQLNQLIAAGSKDQKTIDLLTQKLNDLNQKYEDTVRAIDALFYTQPGIITRTISNVDVSINQLTTEVTGVLENADDSIKQATEILQDADRLIVIKRTAARDSSELTSEEKTYLSDLQKHEQELNDQIKQKQAEIDQLVASGKTDPVTKNKIDVANWQLQNIKNAEQANYREIIRVQYTEPGVIAEILYNVHETVERLNKEEQPRLEKTMDNINLTVVDAQKILNRFNAEEQPRVEKLLDNVNDRVKESQAILKSVDQSVLEAKALVADIDLSVKKVNGGLDLISKYKLPIMIGVGFTALIWIVISIVTLLILLKILLGPVQL